MFQSEREWIPALSKSALSLWAKKLGLGAAAIAITLVMLEIGLRLAGSVLLTRQHMRGSLSAVGNEACTIVCVGESTTAENVAKAILNEVLVSASRTSRGIISPCPTDHPRSYLPRSARITY